ncbi:Cell cycle serine/threonine-protein kinase cdc5/MSD2, variant 2 [Entomophthora muscae]|uniref:Cell cycle serine/threonine-protein kinase cdc5/MSD2, variant 2 n=3 Tax=Entomophthora muscae TaxID=34485 RepID=A0ACC2RLF9_9FUNG|nr:Cell cycle serine/threonine-protein kinase cdc5/MSD2, variant 2 [Entomophthora muscae]
MSSQELSQDSKTDEGIFIKPKVSSVVFDEKRNVHFYIGKNIGEGGFATCYEATCSITGKVICCKTIWKAKLQQAPAKLRVRNEVSIHRKMNHPNVVKYYSSIEDADFVFIFMEICRQGSLKDLLFHRKILTEPEVRFYMLQLLSAVEYFMESKVIHRDLKLANIFVAEDMTLRIGDFGLACKLEAGQDRRTTRCGTPNYTAPEVLYQDSHSYEVDMWALGIIMYTLLVGTPPFQGNGKLKETYFKIQTAELKLPPRANISPEAWDLITLILQAKPEERPDFQQVRSHPFFQGFTPSSLSKDTFRYPPRFAGDRILALKQGLDADGFASPSLIPGLSSPHKRGRFGPAYNPNSPVPPPRTYCFKELEDVAPKPLAQETEVKCIPTPQAVFPGPLSTECAAKESLTEQENTKAVQPQQDDKPMAAVPNSTIIQDAHNIYTKIKELIALGKTTSQIEEIIGEADLTIPNFISKWIFYGENYGQAYEFIDGTIGVNFSDMSSLILASDKEHFEFIEIQDNQHLVTHYTRAEFLKFDSRKLAFFDCFVKKLITATPAINDNVKSDLLTASLQMSAEIPETTSRDPTLPYLLKVNKTKYGKFLRLSNSSIQMNLEGDHSFVLGDKGRCIVAIPKKGTAIQSYSLVNILMQYEQASKAGDPVKKSLSALYSRVSYFLDIISLVAQRKHICQPQKSPLSMQT